MNDKVYVWDPLIRFFHWTLVLAFVVAYFTGDEENILHIYSSYYILGLLAVRLVWGIVGTRYARFSDFVYSPSAVLDYLKGFISVGNAKKYLGHNPAGGWMVIALLISLILTSISGLKVYGLEGHGPLAASSTDIQLNENEYKFIKVSYNEKEHHEDDEHENEHEAREHEHKHENEHEAREHKNEADEHESEDGEGGDEAEEFWEELHELFANFTVLLIFLHISGVVASSLKQGQNLVKSMVTGYKYK